MGCCRQKPKTIQNGDNSITKHQTTFTPPTGAYQLNYVPPIFNNIGLQSNSVVINNNGIVPIARQIISQQRQIQIKTKAENEQFYQSNGFSNGLQTHNNLFRESNVPIPNFLPINVELKDLQALKRL